VERQQSGLSTSNSYITDSNRYDMKSQVSQDSSVA